MSAHDEGGAAPIELRFGKSTVPLEALERTIYALADRMTGAVSEEDGHWILSAYPVADNDDHTELAHAIRRTANDMALRVRIAAETAAVRNLVFAAAFSRTGLTG